MNLHKVIKSFSTVKFVTQSKHVFIKNHGYPRSIVMLGGGASGRH